MIVAHASGFSWDEALIVLTPIALVTFLLTVARRRVRARNRTASPVLRHEVLESRESRDGEPRD